MKVVVGQGHGQVEGHDHCDDLIRACAAPMSRRHRAAAAAFRWQTAGILVYLVLHAAMQPPGEPERGGKRKRKRGGGRTKM